MKLPVSVSAVLISALGACVSPAVLSQTPDAYHGGPSVQFMAFGDLLLQQGDVKESGLQLGQLIGHMNASLDDRTRIFSEVSINERDGKFSTTVERLIVRYEFSDKLKLSAGKYHSPIGYWNETYHHGTWLQNAIFRPHVVRFGSPIIPIHFKGMLLAGDLHQGASSFGYKLGLGQGLHNNLADHYHGDALTSDNAINLALYHKPGSLPKLQYGLGYYQDSFVISQQDRVDDLKVDKRIYSAYLVSHTNPRVVAEGLYFTHHFASPAQADTSGNGYYIQLEHKLEGRWQAWLPYARLDKVSAHAEGPVFQRDENYQSVALGVRYDISDYVALKGEYDAIRRGEQDHSEQRVSLQLSFVIP